jgi:hypothetical protein
MPDKVIFHLIEHSLEIGGASEVMRRLGAAIQHHSQRGDALFQMFEKLDDFVRTRAWKGASRKKHGVAAFRQGVVGVTLRCAAAFVIDDYRMFRVIPASPLDGLPAHVQEHGGRVDADRAHGGAKAAKTALERHIPIGLLFGIVLVGKGFRFAMPLQEGALFFAQFALNAFVGYSLQGRSHSPTSGDFLSAL